MQPEASLTAARLRAIMAFAAAPERVIGSATFTLAKTGVGGGIVAVVPGRMAIVGFSPRVNDAGNSVRAMKAIEYIGDQLGANVFGSGR